MFTILFIIPLIGLTIINVLVSGDAPSTSLLGHIITIGIPLLVLFLLTIFRDKMHRIISRFSIIIYPFTLAILSIAFLYSVPLYSYIIIITGMSFNVLAVVSNGGKMPVYHKTLSDAGLKKINESAMHKFGKNANLSFLIDRIALPNGHVASAGDLLLFLGLWVGFISKL